MSRVAEAAMAATYKQLKEDFVSGLTGGDILEINYVTAVASVSSLPLEYSYVLTNTKDSNHSLVRPSITTIIL